MKNDRPPACKHKIWWMRNKESSLLGLTVYLLAISYRSLCALSGRVPKAMSSNV